MRPSTTVADGFVEDCVDHTLFLAYTGDVRGQTRWDDFGQDRRLLEQDCERIAVRDPNERASLQAEMDQLAAFLSTPAATTTDASVQTTAATRPTTTVRQAPPRVALDCGSAGAGSYDWYRVEFGYAFSSAAPIVEWGMDYGDGTSYSADEESEARNDVYWHKYTSPGSYRATAWVIDANGLRDEASCTWNWTAPAPPPPQAAQPVLPNGACDPNYTGCVPIASDVDCAGGSGNGPAYTGKVQVIGRDIYDLDRDGDGWACE